MNEGEGNATSELGTSTEAMEWVNGSGLDEKSKSNLLKFIMNFPSLTFIRESDEYLDASESEHGVTLPPWFRDLRKIFAGFADSMPARFIAYDEDCARFDIAHKIWYTFSLGDMGEDDVPLFVEYAKIYPIGSWVENDRSYLAISLEDPQDRNIYEFAREDLADSRMIGESSYPDAVFSSYPRMLSRLYQFKAPNGEIVQAANM
ncbi:hypothetical protein [Streptomyces sp. NPDC048142]|uniref:hypothetical protein n=1 Tax=Streptomyces sp. NPDC048142 TaxID=3365501 RepID=UPI003724AF1D